MGNIHFLSAFKLDGGATWKLGDQKGNWISKPGENFIVNLVKQSGTAKIQDFTSGDLNLCRTISAPPCKSST